MTRREYLERYRAALLELSDITLGTYLLHFGGAYRCYRREVPPLDLGDLDLSVGQRARDLLTGKPAAWWNLTQRRIEQLEPQHEGAERYAVEAERAAAAARQRADRLRGELETARARLAELEAAGARVT